jgi:hypothetical protein
MDAQTRALAETRLTDAAAALRLADPRPRLRERLKQLREERADSFNRAVEHYEQAVLPRLAAEEQEPLSVWLEYARFIGQSTANGRLLAIGDDGAAAAFRPPVAPGVLFLFVPDDNAVPAFIAAQPLQPSPAQLATIDLLVGRRLALSGTD